MRNGDKGKEGISPPDLTNTKSPGTSFPPPPHTPPKLTMFSASRTYETGGRMGYPGGR